MEGNWEEEVHKEIDREADRLQPEGPTSEQLTKHPPQQPIEPAPPGSNRRTSRGTGRGRVDFEGDVEREQTRELAHQIAKSSLRQMEAVDPSNRQITNIRWIETEGSRHIDDPDKFCVTEFEIHLMNGRKIKLTGPVINVEYGPT